MQGLDAIEDELRWLEEQLVRCAPFSRETHETTSYLQQRDIAEGKLKRLLWEGRMLEPVS